MSRKHENTQSSAEKFLHPSKKTFYVTWTAYVESGKNKLNLTAKK